MSYFSNTNLHLFYLQHLSTESQFINCESSTGIYLSNITPLAVFIGDIYFYILFQLPFLLVSLNSVSIWPKKQTYFGTAGFRFLHSVQTVENLNKWTMVYLILYTSYAQVWLMHWQCPFLFFDKCFLHNAGSAANASVHFCGFNFVPLFGLSKVFRLK